MLQPAGSPTPGPLSVGGEGEALEGGSEEDGGLEEPIPADSGKAGSPAQTGTGLSVSADETPAAKVPFTPLRTRAGFGGDSVFSQEQSRWHCCPHAGQARSGQLKPPGYAFHLGGGISCHLRCQSRELGCRLTHQVLPSPGTVDLELHLLLLFLKRVPSTARCHVLAASKDCCQFRPLCL